MKVLAITQARISSTRMPAKVLKCINGESLLHIHLQRILKSKRIDKLKVATTTEPDSGKIVDIAYVSGIDVYCGDLENVLDRYFQAAKNENPEWIVRITSDCPLVDPAVIDAAINYAVDHQLDYTSNTMDPTFPHGMDVEVFTFDALLRAKQEAIQPFDLEHVTPYIWRNSTFKGGDIFKSASFSFAEDFSGFRLTVDYPEDFLVIEKLVEAMGSDKTWPEYVRYLVDNPDIFALNYAYNRKKNL